MHLLPFLAVSAVVVITPGVDMALVTKNALVHGRAAAQATAVGVNLGIFFWTIAAALGLAALVAASSTAFLAIKVAGALYLIYLGLKSLRRSGERAEESLPVRSALSRRDAFLQGVTSNLLNPKIAVFFTSLLPQFVDHATAGTFLVLGAIFDCMVALWLVSYAALAARGRALLVRPRVRRTVDRLSGIALVALGARLAFERRR